MESRVAGRRPPFPLSLYRIIYTRARLWTFLQDGEHPAGNSQDSTADGTSAHDSAGHGSTGAGSGSAARGSAAAGGRRRVAGRRRGRRVARGRGGRGALGASGHGGALGSTAVRAVRRGRGAAGDGASAGRGSGVGGRGGGGRRAGRGDGVGVRGGGGAERGAGRRGVARVGVAVAVGHRVRKEGIGVVAVAGRGAAAGRGGVAGRRAVAGHAGAERGGRDGRDRGRDAVVAVGVALGHGVGGEVVGVLGHDTRGQEGRGGGQDEGGGTHGYLLCRKEIVFGGVSFKYESPFCRTWRGGEIGLLSFRIAFPGMGRRSRRKERFQRRANVG